MRLITLALLLAAPAAQAQTVTTEADGSRTLTVEALVPGQHGAVWHAVSTAEGWKRWAVAAAWLTGDVLETAYDPAAQPGGANTIQQRILESVPGRSFVFRTIKVPAGFPHGQAFMGVTHFLQLMPEAGGVRVRLTDKGYPAGPEGDALLGFFKSGNQQTIDHLAAHFGLAPIGFLTGHCWRSSLPNGDPDTHCFKAQDGAVVDHHEVLHDGKKVYWGDTLYEWQAGAISWTYTAMSGGTMKGKVAAAPDGLDFGTADFVGTDGSRITMTTRWVRTGDDSYETRGTAGAGSEGHPAPATRYTRID
jgi:uncharacterized protein YndB with AHSA1/START domain